MSKFSISRKHTMDHEQLLSEVEQLAVKLVQKYGGGYSWEGDVLTYNYSGGVNACVHCAPEKVDVDVKFGMLMSMLKGPVSREIEQNLDKHFT